MPLVKYGIEAANKLKKPLFRFAPSPNGPLHLGHAYSVLLNEKLAKAQNGSLLLRIEDIDKARSSNTHIAAIHRDLHWLGLSFGQPVRYQSAHLDEYKPYIQQLKAAGLLYPCFASRGEIRAAPNNGQTDPDGAPLYPGLYKNLTKAEQTTRIESGTPYALRLDMEQAINQAKALSNGILSYNEIDEAGQVTQKPITPERWGDVIIARKDIETSYHLSVTVDDHLQNITHIVRGRDLEASTDIHRILQIILGFDEPLYHHHELILLEREKLSKSKKHMSLFEMRSTGITAPDIRKAFQKGAGALNALMSHHLK